MIEHPAFTVEPWAIRETHLHLDVLAQSESVFALSNGHVGLRGNLDEGEPHGIPGTYLNSVFELRPLPHAEAGYGYPESGQTVINVANGKLIRLLVDDEPFDVRYGTLESHERVLDLRAGTLGRRVVWTSPTGRPIRISSTRLVSFTQRAIAAICYEVEALDSAVTVVVQSELVANEPMPGESRDPRASTNLDTPLVLKEHATDRTRTVLIHATRESGLLVAAAMEHTAEGPDGLRTDTDGTGDVARTTFATRLEPGEKLRIVKQVAYGWSSMRSRPALHDQVIGALAGARLSGWEGLLTEQRRFLDEFWAGADVEIEGDPGVQQAVRFGLFHVLQAGARSERRPIAAKGLTGTGYDGHTFWDTETFVLPVLTYTYPQATADALRWRLSTLPMAEARAEELGLHGAAFPWRTIRGEECSGYWPAGTAAFHINADIAEAALRYIDATKDRQFERDVAFPILIGTARLWLSLGHHHVDGRFRIDGVTGPDEYSAIADNNLYTNLMAQQNLRAAANAVAAYPDRAELLGATADEAESWTQAASAMAIPYDDHLGVHAQSEDFTAHARWDFASTEPEQYPLLLHFPYFDLYRKQVIKQADLVLAMHLRGDAFTPEEKARNFAYYEELTVRDSSLSAAPQAVMAAEVGQLELAHDYLRETASIDLGDIHHNTRDGLHIASLAGVWSAIVAGFGGMRAGGGHLSFAPRLPSTIRRIAFCMRYRGRRLGVEATAAQATYQLHEGEPLTLKHHGEVFALTSEPVTIDIPPLTSSPRPQQPAGREPARRH